MHCTHTSGSASCCLLGPSCWPCPRPDRWPTAARLRHTYTTGCAAPCSPGPPHPARRHVSRAFRFSRPSTFSFQRKQNASILRVLLSGYPGSTRIVVPKAYLTTASIGIPQRHYRPLQNNNTPYPIRDPSSRIGIQCPPYHGVLLPTPPHHPAYFYTS